MNTLVLRDLIPAMAGLMSITGYETYASESLTALVQGFDEDHTDAVGNRILVRRCGRENAPKILIDTHFDEIGMYVTEILEGGFLKVAAVGGLDGRTLPSADVKIYGKQVLDGVMASTPPHLKNPDDAGKVKPVDELLIDTGYPKDELCEIVHHQMKLQITDKQMAGMIATNVNSERSIILRATPLFLKNIVMKLIFNAVGEKKSCFSFSNLGLVKTPEEFSSYVERMDFVLGVQASAPYNTSLITYNGKMNLNVIRNIHEPILEREIYRVLRDLSLCPTVESNTR
jgi:hypothetical protein